MSAAGSMFEARSDRILAEALALEPAPGWDDSTVEELRNLAERVGIDVATAVLFQRVTRSDRHGPLIRRIDVLRQRGGAEPRRLQAAVVIAPGAFYKEFPHTGADGRILREQAERFGCPTEMIPVRSTGTLEENARTINSWLARREDDRPVILGSVSKGGSDVKLALARPEAAEAFRNVVGWINVCGILSGSPMVNWVRARPLYSLFYRALFRLRGLDFRVISDLAHGVGTPLDGDLRLPAHLRLVSVVGFPLREHLTNRLAHTCHGRIAAQGPNDGAILLADACRLPGLVYPVWGSDHYMRPVWELRSLAGALLEFLGEELGLFAREDSP